MLAAFILIASFSTYGPIGQDSSFLYVAGAGGIDRVEKSDLSRRVRIVTTQRRIAAIDVDGDRVLYATSSTPKCEPFYFGNYTFSQCKWIDTEPTHELRSIPASGGMEVVLASNSPGITEIAHDYDWVYWIEPANGDARDGRLWRRRKEDGLRQLLAENLNVDPENQHPFVLQDDSIWISSGSQLLRILKDGGIATTIIGLFSQTPIAADGHLVYFLPSYGGGAPAQIDSRTLTSSVVPYPNDANGVGYILGVADGRVVTMTQLRGIDGTNRVWHLVYLCDQTWRKLGAVFLSKYQGVVFEPLTEPVVAIDSNAVYIDYAGVLTSVHSPSICGSSSRRRTSRQ